MFVQKNIASTPPQSPLISDNLIPTTNHLKLATPKGSFGQKSMATMLLWNPLLPPYLFHP